MLRLLVNRNISQACFCSSASINSYRNDEYQYFPKSHLPTFHFQPSLPRLPIPDLVKSCEKYLKSQKPLRTPDEYSYLETLVDDLKLSVGPSLQKELLAQDKANYNTSYISAPWFEMYLKDRKPLPINYNPFLVFVDDPKPEYNDQLLRATNLLISSLRFMKSLRKRILEPEVYHIDPKKSNTKTFRLVTGLFPSNFSWYAAYLFKAFPLDMSQYEYLFNTNRIPEKGIDRLFHDESARHITVMKEGNIYKINVLDESGYIHDPETIYGSLKWVLEDDRKPAEYPVGILTTENRDIWADLRNHMMAIGNERIFHAIDSSIFNLILDTDEPTTDYRTLIARHLHSDGSNRWFDKSFSLIIGRNGIAGLNFEHSWGDGVAVLRYLTDVYKDSTSKPQVHPHEAANIKTSKEFVEPLVFHLDDYTKNSILDAKDTYLKTCDTLGIEVFEYLQFGRKLCKLHNISPDSLMQLAFQLAYFKLNNKFASTYESCSTAAFKHGRTETVRPCTVETKDFVESLVLTQNKSISKEDLIRKMTDCSTVHGNSIKDAAMGQGFDRHLFALNHIAHKKGIVIKLFSDPLHETFNHFFMSTSTLNSDFVMLGAFGPVVPDGFGIGYSIWNERLGSIVTYYKNKTDGQGFIQSLEESLKELCSILN